ncbi:MAG: tetratricopeptide repeat protein, partial [Alphaproteobacteria bacterium]
DRFLANPDKRLVQVGWWLRRLTAIDRLPLGTGAPVHYRKLRLIPGFAPDASAHLDHLRRLESEAEGLPLPEGPLDVETRPHVPNDAYDELLSENVAFVQLHAASANNVVVECLARGTPLLVNRLPAVEEYLGPDYPMFYADLADAAAQAVDLSRLRAAHEYLRDSPLRARLSAEVFRRDMEQSEVYQRL